MSQLPGYECDINTLIDQFAIQAHQQQELSFQAFKQLFSDGCYAYIHQAYWGCEHSPEYAQLLFAVALDRLDIPSPTAPPESSLWELHQLIPQGDNLPPGSASMQTDPTEQHLAAAAGGAEAMDVDQLQLLPGPHSFVPPPGQPSSPAGQPAAMQLDEHLEQQQDWLQQPQQQQQQPDEQQQQQANEQQQQQQAGQLGASVQDHLSTQQQQQQQTQPPQQGPPQGQQDQAQQQQQDVAQQQQQQQQLLAQQLTEELLSSPLLLPHQTPPQLGQSGLPLSPGDLWPLVTSPLTTPLQQQQGTGDAGQPDLGCLEEFMLPGPAIPPASQPQQPPQQPPLEQQAMQALLPQMQPPPGVGISADGVQLLPPPLLQQPQPQQPQQQLQGWRMQAEEEDEFLSDLLAIFDEAMQGQEQHQDTAPTPVAGGAAADAAAPICGDAAAGPASAPVAASQPQPQPHQQQPQPILQIPLVVKGAAVFTLLALHESQLNYPKAPVYVPLPLLQQLVAAAGEFRAAGAAAADALQALQVLVQQQRLLVGQFRRPNNWEPQLPPYLMPGGRLPGGLGLNTAIGVVARKAARAAARSSMQYAAVAAAARAARGAAGFDPGVQREAMFHIKSALRTLSNFRSLQSLCDEYAGARNAIFEPLLGTRIPHPVPAPEQQQQLQPAAAPQAQQQQQAGRSKRSKQGGMVVMRGGSRRKRKAALAAAAAVPAAKPGGASQGSPAAAAAAADAGAGAGAAGDASRGQAAAQAAVAASTPAAAGVDLPELFDTAFAASLQGLANSEAARMLLLLDPYYNANQVRKRTKEEKRAAKAAEEAAAAAAKGRLSRFQRLTMKRAGAGGQDRQQQQQPSRSAPAAPAGVQGFRHELLAAGVFSEQDLQDASASLADLGGDMRGGAQQALRRAAQQRQTAVQVAQEWLRAQSALVVVDGDEDEDGGDGDGGEDMP